MDEKKKFNDFPYGIIKPIDITLNPYALYDRIKSKKIFCRKCHEMKKIYYLTPCIKIICGCGIGYLNCTDPDKGLYEWNFKSKYDLKKKKEKDLYG